ncbi:MAG TPA: hypothetical protein VLI54_06425 [Bacillota bacterium]|nr:hypothetical protein [Bacillota bacterium]
MAEISSEMYERLRQILEKQNGQSYTFEEAKEIGDGLVDFYEMMIKFYEDETDSTETQTAL